LLVGQPHQLFQILLGKNAVINVEEKSGAQTIERKWLLFKRVTEQAFVPYNNNTTEAYAEKYNGSDNTTTG